MLPRHWTRLSDLTGHSFQVESESFSLRNIMKAPLLRSKEDIEVHKSRDMKTDCLLHSVHFISYSNVHIKIKISFTINYILIKISVL